MESIISEAIALSVALSMGYRYGPRLAVLTAMPLITLYLLIGAILRLTGTISDQMLLQVHPLHNAALACITFAAGSELELEALRSHARVIGCLATSISAAALIMCFGATFFLFPTDWLLQEGSAATHSIAATGANVGRIKFVACALAGVVAIARSPSSAIAVVAELQASGPYTQCMLSVTMITDVAVIVLFTAASELGQVLLSSKGIDAPEHEQSALEMIAAFSFHTLADFASSLAHGGMLAALCLGLLRLPGVPGVRHGALLLVGAWAFAAEPLMHALLHGSGLVQSLRLEPMLACIIAGFIVCNVAGRRRPFSGLLRRGMPPILCFFFTTTGADMHGEALKRAWACALGLFAARLFSLYVGTSIGCRWAGMQWTDPARWLAGIHYSSRCWPWAGRGDLNKISLVGTCSS